MFCIADEKSLPRRAKKRMKLTKYDNKQFRCCVYKAQHIHIHTHTLACSTYHTKSIHLPAIFRFLCVCVSVCSMIINGFIYDVLFNICRLITLGLRVASPIVGSQPLGLADVVIGNRISFIWSYNLNIAMK